MKKANTPTGIFFNLGQDLKDDNPSWSDVQQEAKDLAQLAAALAAGDAAARRQGFLGQAHEGLRRQHEALEQATAKKDQETARAAWAKIDDQACKTCHAVHRPPE